jgi:VanZ family protein
MDLVMLAIFAGAAVEVFQSLTGRDGEIGDLLADAAGALAVFAPIYLERQRELRTERRASRLSAAPVSEPRSA